MLRALLGSLLSSQLIIACTRRAQANQRACPVCFLVWHATQILFFGRVGNISASEPSQPHNLDNWLPMLRCETRLFADAQLSIFDNCDFEIRFQLGQREKYSPR